MTFSIHGAGNRLLGVYNPEEKTITVGNESVKALSLEMAVYYCCASGTSMKDIVIYPNA